MVARVTVTLPDELLTSLDQLAGDDGTTRSEVVREAAVRYVTHRVQGRAASARRRAVDDGVAWLETLADAVPPEAPTSDVLLRELRSGEPLSRPGAPEPGTGGAR